MDPKTGKNAPTLYPSSRRFLDIVVDAAWLNNYADESMGGEKLRLKSDNC
jgi:hypothetical protein